ncbi:DUF6680 family protein [Caulobacter hibisci]|uniref:DUF6680 domain-containing protein n=1 Tax=Caulobacter hibisci TaxID=2035993 RepID=A0ABS0T6Z2_9CAUL|nr:DUF6680 family protein [Caulobacter hibisci]MBI1686850.1 hypothetical protein [Caulobacter hibisci]
MRGIFSAEGVQAIASALTFLAACVAVWASFRAPRLAAQFAEQLRRDSAQSDEQRRLKMMIFTTLLQNRAHISHPDCVTALNLIDLAFIDDREVRDALAHFRAATDDTIRREGDRAAERFLVIIEKISRSLGMSDRITISDIRTPYYPTGLAELHEMQRLEMQDKLTALRKKRR